MPNKEQKYFEIINGKIRENFEPHPFNVRNNSKKNVEIFEKIFKDEFKKTNINLEKINTKSFALSGSINTVFYYDHVDPGGMPKSKKISIDYKNENFRELIRNYDELNIINIYIPLIEINNNEKELDYNNYIFLILNKKNFLNSEEYSKIKNHSIQKNKDAPNNSSRWISNKDIEAFINSTKIYDFSQKKSKNDLTYNTIMVKKNHLVEVLQQELFPEEKIDNFNTDYLLNNVVSRKGQDLFREKTLKKFKETCPLSNIKHTSLLISSHIKPWSESNDIERLDENNGLLLISSIDKLFDNFEISFDENGYLVWSNDLSKELLIKIGVLPDFVNKKKSIYEIINDKSKKYMEFHYKKHKKNVD